MGQRVDGGDEWRPGSTAARAIDGTGCGPCLLSLRHDGNRPANDIAELPERRVRKICGVNGTKTMTTRLSRLYSVRRRVGASVAMTATLNLLMTTLLAS